MIHDKKSVRNLAVAVAVAITLSLFPQIAGATYYYVNTYEDSLAIDKKCSLREAIRAASIKYAVDTCPAGSGTWDNQLMLKASILSREWIIVPSAILQRS